LTQTKRLELYLVLAHATLLRRHRVAIFVHDAVFMLKFRDLGEAILKHRLMSDDYQRIELITGAVRRRQWTTEQKLQIIEESFQPGETVSSVARRRGVAPNLLYRWRRLMTEGGAAAVGSDEPVVGSSEVRRLEERVRELERMLGRKTMEVEILREALAKSESKKPSLRLLSHPKDASR
jgi:transposase